jgi:hypothetical protein
MLVVVLVTSAIALADAWTGDRAVLLGLLIAGPLLAAASLDAQHTTITGLYALGLAVLLGLPDGTFGTWPCTRPGRASSRCGQWGAPQAGTRRCPGCSGHGPGGGGRG